MDKVASNTAHLDGIISEAFRTSDFKELFYHSSLIQLPPETFESVCRDFITKEFIHQPSTSFLRDRLLMANILKANYTVYKESQFNEDYFFRRAAQNPTDCNTLVTLPPYTILFGT